MKDKNLIYIRAWTYLAMTLVLTASAGAKAGSAVLREGRVSGVEIAVWGTGDDEVRLEYGETVTLKEGEKVTLRAYAPRGHAPKPGRWYLPGTFYVTTGTSQVRLGDIDVEKGFCTLTAVQSIRGKAAQITFRLANHIGVTRTNLRQGVVNFYIEPGRETRPPSGGGHHGPWAGHEGRTSEREMVELLFQGILLRNPGRAADYFESTIRRDGYEGVVDVANQIAESREAERDSLSRVSSKAEHLETIYRYLLGLKPSEIDRYQWNDHLEMLNRGDLVGVVMDIVRSPEFRRVHGYESFGRRFDDRDRDNRFQRY